MPLLRTAKPSSLAAGRSSIERRCATDGRSLTPRVFQRLTNNLLDRSRVIALRFKQHVQSKAVDQREEMHGVLFAHRLIGEGEIAEAALEDTSPFTM